MASTFSMDPASMNTTITNSNEQIIKINTESSKIKSELSWFQVVQAEIFAVTSAMRKNARWSGMGVNGLRMSGLGNGMGLRGAQITKDSNTRVENPFMEGFINLKSYMETVTDIQDVDAVNLLNPFLEVIRSGHTTGPIAGTALGSVEKLLNYGIIGVHNPRVSAAMNALTLAVAHCKFVASDATSDELVLLRMLQVLEVAITSECGQVLSDEAVCEMMGSSLSMCCQMRLSEMLRRSVEHAMMNMIIAIFERLKILDDEWQFGDSGNEDNDETADPHMTTPKPSPSPTPQPTVEANTTEDNDAVESNEKEPLVEKSIVESPKAETPALEDSNNAVEPTPSKPYGLPAIRELLRTLISLLNPHDHKHTDSMRLMALGILNVAFEVGGKSIGRFESLRLLVTDEFCKYVFQLAKTDSIPLLSLSLRVISTVFDTLRPYLKLQQQLFISFLIERLDSQRQQITVNVDDEGNVGFVSSKLTDLEQMDSADSRSPSPNMFLGKSTDYPRSNRNYSSSEQLAISAEVRELLLESLVQMASKPNFMIDLWYNYDCDLACGDLFEEMIQFLCKNSFPDYQNYTLTSFHILCLDSILSFVNQMVHRISQEDTEEDNTIEYASVEELKERKNRKKIILKGSRLFNESPKKGIQFLTENGIIKADENGQIYNSLSSLLRSTQQLDKKSLGEYLGRPENFETLKAYMQQFDFKGKRIDEAMRMVLETFRLPGESQQIMRVTESFAATYFESVNPTEIANIEATEVLAYSVIMLNTDQHSPQVRRQARMSVDQYIRNVSGVNNKKDFPREYLVAIYEAIQQNEILMPEEHEGLLGFNYGWKQLQHRSLISGQFIQCNTTNYNKAVFESAWKHVVAAISYAFSTAQDDDTLQSAISGFNQCATLASHFELYDVFDSIVLNLTTMTGLLDNANGNTSVPDPLVEVEGQKYVVTNYAVRFGRNYKGQLAAVVMFNIVTRCGNSLRKGWTKVLWIIRNLFLNSLLPNSMLQVEDFLAGTTSIPLKPKSPKPAKQTNRRDGSLLSTLSSYLLSPYSNDESYCREPTVEEVESTMCAVDYIAECKLEELFTDINTFDIDTLICLLKAIRSVGYDTEVMKKAAITIPYDPATVLFLEFMITVTARNADRIEELWPYATEYVFGILDFADKQSVLVVERTVVGLLRLCICSATRNVMLDEILKCLRLLRDFPPNVTQAVAEQMMAGIFNLSSANSENRNNTEFLNTILEIKQKVANSL